MSVVLLVLALLSALGAWWLLSARSPDQKARQTLPEQKTEGSADDTLSNDIFAASIEDLRDHLDPLDYNTVYLFTVVVFNSGTTTLEFDQVEAVMIGLRPFRGRYTNTEERSDGQSFRLGPAQSLRFEVRSPRNSDVPDPEQLAIILRR